MQRVTVVVVFLAIFTLMHIYELSAEQDIQVQEHSTKEREGFERQSSKRLSRQKRGLGALFRSGLSGAAWGTYALSFGSTVYHAIRKCKEYKPIPCKRPACLEVNPCPSVCRNPEKNREYVDDEKEVIKGRLDLMDQLLLSAYQLEIDAKSVITDNKRIVNEITKINNNLDLLTLYTAELDEKLSEKFRNKSVEVEALLRNQRLSLDDIVASPAMQGIFDKWTWKGTGQFVLSLAFNIGYYVVYGTLQKRFAVNKLYKEMKADFYNKFSNQKYIFSRKRFAYVQGLTTSNINAQIKQNAKTVYKARQALQKQNLVNRFVTPAINALYSAFSVWSTYKQYKNCQKTTNDMQQTAIDVTDQRDKIEKIMRTEVKPLLGQVKTQAWLVAKNFLTNETIINVLENIRNLTLEANSTNTVAANTIKNFINNIGQADVAATKWLQRNLIAALKSIKFEFACLADKQHAVTIVVNDCKSGRDDFKTLYSNAQLKYKLNRQGCIKRGIIPYTTQEQLARIVSAVAKEKKWYSKCLLNNYDLLLRVCAEKRQGYKTPTEILAQVNKSGLTECMVGNFLTRCPPATITPVAKELTCKMYCSYDTPREIAQSVRLQESQVNEIIKKCDICIVAAKVKTEICALQFCEGESSLSIERKVRLPQPTIEHVITNCVQKCVANDAQKREICKKLRCQGFHTDEIASKMSLPVDTISDVARKCKVILPSCGPVSDGEKKKVLILKCQLKASAKEIFTQKLVRLTLRRIKSVIKSQTCKDYLANGPKS